MSCLSTLGKVEEVLCIVGQKILPKGANEVASVLDHYLRVFLKRGVKHLLIYTDGCRGQNVNHTMVRFWQSLVQNGKFESCSASEINK